MSSINDKSKEEPNAAPQTDRWYNLSLGSTFKDHTSTKFCTLRYEFKPASIDKNQPGSLHKNKDRVTVEFQNNQPGKPKLSFEGKSEDYKDSDAVLFFDGQTFRLERLHRAVKQLRHVRLPGESAAAAAGASSVGPSMEARSPPLGKGAKSLPPNKALAHSVPVEVERIDIGETEIPGAKPTGRGFDDYHHHASAPPNPSTTISLPDQKSDEMEEEQVDIDIDDIGDSVRTPNRVTNASAATEIGEFRTGFDINLPTQNDMDDEIADVDVSDDETAKGPNAAEALRAQVNANTEGGGGGGGGGQTSSSSGSSDSGSSSGSSSSSSSDSAEASDDDSVNSI